jgi:hypothetical protein
MKSQTPTSLTHPQPARQKMRFKNPIVIAAKLLVATMLFLALTRHSYIYTLLRWALWVASATAGVRAYEARQTGWALAFAIVAVIFNPFIPFLFEPGTWAVIDFCAAVFMLASVPFTDRDSPE